LLLFWFSSRRFLGRDFFGGAVDFLFALAFPFDFEREDATKLPLHAGKGFPGDFPFAIIGF
jgi:hypothetical protein